MSGLISGAMLDARELARLRTEVVDLRAELERCHEYNRATLRTLGLTRIERDDALVEVAELRGELNRRVS